MSNLPEKSKGKLCVYTRRVSEKDLPARAICRYGNINSSKITWGKPRNLALHFKNKKLVDSQGGCWSGFNSKTSVYAKHDTKSYQNVICFQILHRKGSDVFTKIKKTNFDDEKDINTNSNSDVGNSESDSESESYESYDSDNGDTNEGILDPEDDDTKELLDPDSEDPDSEDDGYSKEEQSDDEDFPPPLRNRKTKPHPVYKRRVGKKDLPAVVYVQLGEIFGKRIEWCVPSETTLKWDSKVNPNNDEGILDNSEGWGFAGYDKSQSVYLRYNESLENQEHCMRILSRPDHNTLAPVTVDADTTDTDIVPADVPVADADTDVPVDIDDDAEFLSDIESNKEAKFEFKRRDKPKSHNVDTLKDLSDYQTMLDGGYLPGDVVLVGKSKSGFPRFIYVIESMTKSTCEKKNRIELELNSVFCKLKRVEKAKSTLDDLTGQERYLGNRLIETFGVDYWSDLSPEESFQCDFYTREKLDVIGDYVKNNKSESLKKIQAKFSKQTIPAECLSKAFVLSLCV